LSAVLTLVRMQRVEATALDVCKAIFDIAANCMQIAQHQMHSELEPKRTNDPERLHLRRVRKIYLRLAAILVVCVRGKNYLTTDLQPSKYLGNKRVLWHMW
jgi:hypothetical protein